MRPLAYPIFRWLLLACLLAEIGTWMQFVGSEWLLTSQTLDPLQVALLAAAGSFPTFLLGIPAGVMADIFGRRNVLLAAQFWMMGFAIIAGLFLWTAALGPWMLILLTFALYCGMTLQEPALHAVYPELVPRRDLPAAVALHAAEFNFARVAGPLLAGVAIRQLGLSSAFIANILSFVGLIWFLLVWKPMRETSHKTEAFVSAMKSAVRYVRFSPELQTVMFFGGVHALLWVSASALLPIVARSKLHLDSGGYGALLSCLGLGSVFGASIAAAALSAIRANRVVSAGMVLASVSIFTLSKLGNPVELGFVLLLSGVGIAATNSSLFALAQSWLPDWARARVMGIYLLIFSGGISVGVAAFGWLALWAGVGPAQAIASGCLLLLAVLAALSRLRLVPDGGAPDTVGPELVQKQPPISDPVMVMIEYEIPSDRLAQFSSVMKEVQRVRRRDGAKEWNLCENSSHAGRFIERFVVETWTEFQRRSEQFTEVDRALQPQLFACHLGGVPRVTYLSAGGHGR